jgi:hypothetical protein
MKNLITLFALLTFVNYGNAQCDSAKVVKSFWGFPSFNSLNNTGQCISANITDTTICVKVKQILATQQARFSYSSPFGSPLLVNEIRQYNSDCIFTGYGNLIDAGIDTVVICFDISSELIDNFCPYSLIISPLAVEFCGLSAVMGAEFLNVQFKTCSNTNTDRFELIISKDLIRWDIAETIQPQIENNSNQSVYQIQTDNFENGINYLAIREIDLNGNETLSEIAYFECRNKKKSIETYFDLLGRNVGSDSPFKIVRND